VEPAGIGTLFVSAIYTSTTHTKRIWPVSTPTLNISKASGISRSGERAPTSNRKKCELEK